MADLMRSVCDVGIEAISEEFGSELLRSPETQDLFACKLRVHVGIKQWIDSRINGAKNGHIFLGSFVPDLLRNSYDKELSAYLSNSLEMEGKLIVDGLDCMNWLRI